MAVLLRTPRPSVDWDPGGRQRPGRQHSCPCVAIAWLPPGPPRGQGKERAVCLSARACSLRAPGCGSALAFSAPGSSQPLPQPCSIQSARPSGSLSSPSRLSCPALSRALLARLPPPSSRATPWCVLVSASARPGRTDGSLWRPRSPWAPTPCPPPGAAQVSRWKVRGAAGKEAWA